MKITHNISHPRLIATIISCTGYCFFSPTTNADVTFDGTMGPGGTLSGPTMEITENMGTVKGNNLYHSFSDFNVNTGQIANFSGSDNIQNILGRVTGSSPSNIDGTISSSIQGANLFLMNPNGMLFGPNAQINISGSFHATTADYLKLGENEHFYADINQNTSLSVAAPSAFGFLDSDIGRIEIKGSDLNLAGSKDHSFVGGNIIVDADPNDTSNTATVSSLSGQIGLVSVQSAGEAFISVENISEGDFENWGNVLMDNSSTIETSGSPAGKLVIRSGTLTLDNNSNIEANSAGSASSEHTENIDIRATKLISLNNESNINTDIDFFNSGNTNGILLITESLQLKNESLVESTAKFFSTGDSGDININAHQISLENDSKIRTETWGTGNAGSIFITSENKTNLSNNSYIESVVTTQGTGNGGNISITSDELTLADYSKIQATNEGDGNSGNITLNVNDLSMSNASLLKTTSKSDANTGNINIHSENISITGPETSPDPFGDDFTGIYTWKNSAPTGGGDIVIENSENVTLDSRAMIVSINKGADKGGDINITSNVINVLSGSQIGIQAREAGDGNGGNLNISAENVNVTGVHDQYFISDDGTPNFFESTIFTAGPEAYFSTGNMGNITITADRLNVLDGAQILSTYFQSTGTIGDISIVANDIQVSGTNKLKNEVLSESSVTADLVVATSSALIKTQALFKDLGGALIPTQDTGKIQIAADNLHLNDHGYISSETSSAADSSDIDVKANTLEITNGSYISSSGEFGKGTPGEINIEANSLQIIGNNASPATGIFSNTSDPAGDGGNIIIRTDSIALANWAVISSGTTGNSNGGDILISAINSAILRNNSGITTAASDNADGNAGNIAINTKFLMLDNSYITTSAISGNGGNIDINTSNIVISEDSIIDAASEQSVSGSININTTSDISSQLIELQEKPTDVTSKFKGQCSFNPKEDSTFHVRNDNQFQIHKNYSPSGFMIELEPLSQVKNNTIDSEEHVSSYYDNIYTWNNEYGCSVLHN